MRRDCCVSLLDNERCMILQRCSRLTIIGLITTDYVDCNVLQLDISASYDRLRHWGEKAVEGTSKKAVLCVAMSTR